MSEDRDDHAQLRPAGPEPAGSRKAKIIHEAKDRFQRCVKWEAYTRKLWLDDMKFSNADSDNGWQWPNDIKRNRDVDERPSLTINKVRQHNLQIINDAKQNKPGVAVRATGNGATFESAQVLESIVRHIEYQSNAATAYDTATMFQVNGGFGYWRIATDYVDDKNFDQEIFIRRGTDPLALYIDPDAKEADKSDMRFAFLYEDVANEEFDKLYPKYKGMGGQAALGAETDWITSDKVRICEYFRRVEKERKIYSVRGGDGEDRMLPESVIPKTLLKSLIDDPQTRYRNVVETKVERIVIVGELVVEENEWPGMYIPIVPVIGEEIIIEGRLDRRGHTRAMKDAQRMYNYWTSAGVEFGALQTKTPYIGAVAAIEGYETYWNSANRVNSSILPFNHLDDAGNEIPPPERVQPPTAAPAYIDGMKIAQDELMMVSGQYQDQMGQRSNERSGKAIAERQRQGDTATYHYIDQLAISIRHTGKILLDLIPKIYDTNRVMRILAEDGTDFEIEIDPRLQQAFEQKLDHDNKVVARLFNPAVGRYDVEAEVGPGYATKREEAFNAFTLILTQAPELASIIGDILFRAGDFPMADEAAARLRRMVPQQALGLGPTQMEQQLQQQVQQLQQLLQKAMDQSQTERLKLKGKDQQKTIDVYDAETRRMAALAKVLDTDEEGVKSLVQQLVSDALTEHLGQVALASEPDLRAQAANEGTQPMLPMAMPQQQLPPGVRVGVGGQHFMRNYANMKNYRPV